VDPETPGTPEAPESPETPETPETRDGPPGAENEAGADAAGADTDAAESDAHAAGVEAAPAEPAPDDKPRPSLRRALLKVFAAIAAILLIAFLWTWFTWPNVSALRTTNPETTAFIEMYQENRRAAGESDAVRWTQVPYDQISPNLKRAVISSEDTEFFFHDGFSAHEMREAFRKAVREREAPRGASTITQQLAKNLWLTPDRSVTRKAREALLTKQLEAKLSKERILAIYLNVVEFGPGIYGAETASQAYFGLPASRLSPRQGAMLAAGLPRPKQWNPHSTSDNYARAVERILTIERQLGFLDKYFGPETGGAPTIEVTPPSIEAEEGFEAEADAENAADSAVAPEEAEAPEAVETDPAIG
jgi:monofunctional biosynthetic peptidoglycan transglycosylase